MDKQFSELFRIRHNDGRIASGKVLIAEPFLQGSYFGRSVVYLVEYNERGSVGFVLNKPLGCTTSELLTQWEGVEFPVFLGGPVEQNQLYYIHTREDIPGAVRIAGGVFWGGDFHSITRLLKSRTITPGEVRFFAGYSGWEGGQLEGEMKEHSWLVGEIDRTRLFSTETAGLWEMCMRGLGGQYRIWADFPKDPLLN